MSLDAHVVVELGDFTLDAALRLGPGETVAVLGPNGAGKSTLLRAIAGLETLRAGQVRLDGDTVDDPSAGVWVPPERRSIPLVFQDNALLPHLTVLDNVAFGLVARGVPRREARSRAREWLVQVGVEHAARRRPATLSGGEAQRVGLARALAVEPRAVLLDEPLAALDATGRVEARALIRSTLDRLGACALVVTHDPVDASALAPRAAVLEAGRVVQVGTHAELAARPGSRYVADLVGVNLVVGRASGATIRLDDGVVVSVAVPPPSGSSAARFHPRAVALHVDRPEGSPRNVWQGVIEDVAASAESRRVRVRIGTTTTVVAEVTAAAADALDLAPGRDVWASVKASEITAEPA